MTAHKGDMVTINRVDEDTKVVTVKSGIVIKTRKKEVTNISMEPIIYKNFRRKRLQTLRANN